MLVRGIFVLFVFPVVALFGGFEPSSVSSRGYSFVKDTTFQEGPASEEATTPEEDAAEEDGEAESNDSESMDDGSYEVPNTIFGAQTPDGPGSIEKLTLPVVTLLVAVALFFVTKASPGKKTT